MLPERTASSYGPGVTSASKAVLLELVTLLRAYQEALILVGGWAPYFLLERYRRPDDSFSHVGSIDIDLAIDPARVGAVQYETIVDLLTSRGYRPASDRRGTAIPCSFERVAPSPATTKPYTIRVDFLTPVPAGFGSDARGAAQIQDALFAKKVRGCEMAFRHHLVVPLSGTLPERGQLTVPVRLVDLVGSLTMKGIVLGERFREKDAYDIYALVHHYGRGPVDVAAALRPHLHEDLVRDALTHIREAFSSRQAHGPAWVANFLVNPMFGAAHARLMTQAFMVVNEFFTQLKEPVRPSDDDAPAATS